MQSQEEMKENTLHKYTAANGSSIKIVKMHQHQHSECW
jgi:hypothetical protein